MAARKRRKGQGKRRGERKAPPAPSPVSAKKAAAIKAAKKAAAQREAERLERERQAVLSLRRERDRERRAEKKREAERLERERQKALKKRRERDRARRAEKKLEAEREAEAARKAAAKKKPAKKPAKKKPEAPKKPAKKKPTKKPRTVYDDLGDLLKEEVKTGEIVLPVDDRIHRRDNYGHTYDKSLAVLPPATNADIYDQLPDLMARLMDAAGELNDFVRGVPYAIQSQSVPRFWTTVEFLVEAKAMRKGSPKKFFRKRGGKTQEFALTYDGHPAVRLERYRAEATALLQSLAAGAPVLLFAMHVGATVESPRNKRRRGRPKR
jgi:chemotaxis protein histidine kinase CheA